MRKNKLLLLLALLLTAATGAWAQEQWDVVWDFTAWSTETVTALKADAAASKTEGWSDVEKAADAEAGADPDAAAKDNCFWFAGTVNEDGSLSANGAVIKELKGLKFNSNYAAKRSLAIAVNYPSTSLGDYAGGAYLLLGGGGSKQTFPCFTIPGVKAGSKITIEVESHKPSDGRGIGLYKNSYAAENLIGEQFKPTAKEVKTWEIAEDCDVVVWNTSNCHIYTIKVKAPAAAASTGYTVSLKDGVKDADKWTVKVGEGEAQELPLEGLEGGEKITATYSGTRKVKSVKAVKKEAGKTVDLSTLTADYEAQDGDVLTGVTSSFKVTIAAGATVTLDGVTISRSSYCIKCLGDATIILKDGSTNTLTGTGDEYPALSIGDANTTLTIQGSTGVLNVTSGPYCAGIGGGYSNTNRTCGNIRIEGGVITAQGGSYGSGIGSDSGPATCGDIIITGGTITAKGGASAAGIGTGRGASDPGVCGDITIANTVTKVTATMGENAVQSIGKGYGSKATCGTVTIGGTKYWENNAAVNGGDTYLATSPLIYDPSN